MASQAKLLLAIISGSTRRSVSYWMEDVLRSTLYSIPQSEDETTCISSLLKNINDYSYGNELSQTKASLTFFEVKNIVITKSFAENETSGVSSLMSAFDLVVQSYEIEIKNSEIEKAGATSKLSFFKLTEVKITSKQIEVEKAAVTSKLSSFSLT